MSKKTTQTIFLVDNKKEFLEQTARILKKDGFANFRLIYKPEKLESVLELLADTCIVIFNATESNLEIIKSLSKKYHYIPKIAISEKEIDSKYFDYITYFVERGEVEKKLPFVLKKAIEIDNLYREKELLRQTIFSEEGLDFSSFDRIITKNENMFAIFKYLKAVSKSYNPILLIGESGTGKSYFAEALNQEAGGGGKFIEVHPNHLDKATLQKQFFGEEKEDGTLVEGLVQKAEDGTIYIKEINKLDEKSQDVLYNFIVDRKYSPVNSANSYFSSVKIVTGSRKDLTQMAQQGQIRDDLYYTLRTFQVYIPPLRERVNDDLLLLVNEQIRKETKKFNKKRPVLDEKTIDLLFSYDYPGNIYELNSMIKYAVSKNGTTERFYNALKEYIENEKSKRKIETKKQEYEDDRKIYFKSKKLPTIDETTKELIRVALVRSGFRIPVAAKFLGITKAKLQEYLVKYNIDINEIEEEEI